MDDSKIDLCFVLSKQAWSTGCADVVCTGQINFDLMCFKVAANCDVLLWTS